MYSDADFCNYIQQAAGEQLLSAKAFAYCFIAADEEERQKRLDFLQAAACGYPHPADSSMPGKGLDPALFEQARARWESEWKADPKGFTDCALSGSLWQSAAVLRVRQLPRLRYVAEGLLPQGLVLLASPPKYGKSWLALDLCLSVASGKPFLGRPCQRGECLYLALEDGEQRLQSRMSRLLGDQPAPAGLFYQTKAVSLDNGLLTNLDFFAVKYPRARLIVIDTLQKIRGEERTASSVYAADYAVMGQLKEFADRHGICLLLVHHLRKMSDDADPFNRIAGSNGIFGAADAAMVLARSKRSDPRTTLSLTGRDVEEQELILTFDKARCRWQVLGDACEVEARDEQAAYDADPLVVTIRHKLDEGGGRWQTGGMGIVEACRQLCGEGPATGQEAAALLKQLAPRLKERDGIAWHCRTTGTSGRRLHLFARTDAPNATIPTIPTK